MPQTSELLWYIAWITVIGVSAMLLALAVSRMFRKRLRRETRTEAFTLQDLRGMRDAGDITQQEYEAMRATIIGEMTTDLPSPSAGKTVPPPGPDSEAADRRPEGASDRDDNQEA